MPFLRLMTFNMQLLPEIKVPVFDIALMPTSGNESEERAALIGDALAALPASEVPDVLVANEVFHEKARDALESRIKGIYPFILSRFEDPAWKALLTGL